MSRTIEDLRQMQSLPLQLKVSLTKARIRQWVNEYGVDGVYVSFSGGKDSTVLLKIARELYPDIRGMFVNTGLEYPEIVDFVKTFENIDIIKPAKNFKKVITEHGYPFISKEVSDAVGNSKKHLELSEKYKDKPAPYGYTYRKLMGIGEYSKETGDPKRVRYSQTKWKFLLDAPFLISNRCCFFMKKHPAHKYNHQTGRNPITAQMADESRLRTQQWLRNGCNGFDLDIPTSNPMSFWLEQDVLQYIYENNVQICSVYGDVKKEYIETSVPKGQLKITIDGEIKEPEATYSTSGCSRTGCVFCGFGCHLEKEGDGRFERLKETHPKLYDYVMRAETLGGLGYKEKIDWINEHGNLNIRY